MKRLTLILVALVGATLLSCGTDVREGGDPTPEEITDEVVSVGRDVMPALSSALGVPAPNVPMRFTERGGFGLYDYDGTGQFQGVTVSPDTLRQTLEQAVTDGGMTLEKASLEDVRATRGNVIVRLSVGAGVDASSRSVELSIGSIQPISADEDDVDIEPRGLMDMIEQ